MKKIVNQILCLVAIFVINSTYYSQTKNKYTFYNKILAIDSLAGFDENFYINLLTVDGFLGEALDNAILNRKRAFIDSKYNLNNINQLVQVEPVFPFQSPLNFKNIGNPAVINVAPCVNEGFESTSGSAVGIPIPALGLAGWRISRGTNSVNLASSPQYNNCQNPGTGSQDYTLSTFSQNFGISAVSPYDNAVRAFSGSFGDNTLTGALVPPGTSSIIPVSPFSGNIVIRLNDNVASGGFSKITNTFVVTATNNIFKYAYLAVMRSSSNHTCCGGAQQAGLKIALSVLTTTGSGRSEELCPRLYFAVPKPNDPSGTSCSTSGLYSSWSNSTSAVGPGVDFTRYSAGTGAASLTPTWQQGLINLSAFINSTVAIDFVATDCAPSGHFGYAYIDSECEQLGVTITTPLSSTFVATPSSSVNLTGLCGQSATLSAITGAASYTWAGPTGTVFTRTITTSVAGAYTITMSEPGGCTPFSRVVNLTFPPTTTLSIGATVAQATTVCSGIPLIISSTPTTAPITYAWLPGPFSSASIAVSPTATTIYTITATSGTCIGTKEVTVTVIAAPTITATSGNACSGSTVALTAGGAGIGGTYTWSPGSVIGSPATFTPVANTTYTVIGTNILTGCTGSVTTNVTVTGSLTLQHAINAFLPLGATLVPTVCIGGNAGGSVNGGIASQYTWTAPGNTVVGANVTLNPTITGPYTITANNGACISSTITQNVVVDPGPTMTVTPSISTASICAGTSTIIIATSSVSPITYSWNTGATTSSISVTPSVTTSYTVYGTKVSTGCISSSVTNIFVFPQPTINLSSFVNVTATNSICVGGTITGVSTGAGVGGTYIWLPGNLNGTPQTLSPTVTTIYTVTGTSASGCTNTALIAITVISNPIITAIANPTSICQGATSTLSAFTATSSSTTFGFAGSIHTFSAPVTGNYTLQAWGGKGGNDGQPGANGGYASGVLALNAGQTVAIYVGGIGTGCLSNSGGGWNGGGNAGPNGCSGGGGGASDVRFGGTALINRVLVAGGGGGGGNAILAGAGGGLNGDGFVGTPSSGGSQIAGGTGGNGNGSLGQGGNHTADGAGGGGGYYGGSAGNGDNGGGGGSSYIAGVSNGTTIAGSASMPNPTGGTMIGNAATGLVRIFYPSASTSYLWSTGATTSSISVSPLTNTSYTVTGSTAGCTGSITVSVTVNPLPVVTASASPTSICPGSSAVLTASGASTYLWNTGATTATISVSPIATTGYTVTGTSVSGCTSSAVVTLTVNPIPTILLTPASASICVGGSVSVSASGASTYTWLPGNLNGSPQTLSPTVTTIYTVTATSASGCTNTAQITITVVPNPTITATATPTAICLGAASTLSASGSTSYLWSTGATTSSISVSPVTNTSYTVTGSTAGCTGSITVSVTVNPLPVVTASASPTSICPGVSAILTGGGGSTYLWNTGATTATISVSPITTTGYTVTGTSVSGCTSSAVVTLTVNPIPTIVLTPASASICVGGSVSVAASGASTFTWLPGNLNGTPQILSPTVTTIYTVTATSASGCTNTAQITITVVPNPTLTASANPTAICLGAASTLSASGSTSYLWSTGATTSSISVSPVTNTSYTVTGSTAGCTGSITVSVTVNPLPVVTASASPTSICPGVSAILTGGGGSTYLWNTGATTATISVSPITTTGYTVTGTSVSGCTSSAVVTLTVNPIPTIVLTPASASICVGGSVSVAASGASTFTWLPGNLNGTPQILSPTVTTIYTLTATSASGCTNTAQITITVVPNPTLTATANPTAICLGAASTLSASGSTTYTWSTGATTQSTSVTPLLAGTSVYTVTGSTAGCNGSTTVSVLVNPNPTITAVASPTAICPGASAVLTASGVSTYLWNTGATTGSISVSPTLTTSYTVTGTSVSGCTSVATVSLLVNPTPTIVLTPASASICAGGSISVGASGASTYTWLPGNLNGTPQTLSPTVTTIYTVTGTSASGCTNTAQTTITVVPNPTLTATANPTAICLGAASTLSASGSTTYSWSTGATTQSTSVTPLLAGTSVYTVTGTTAGCSGSITVSVLVNPNPTITAVASPTAICPGASAVLTASGASTYLWNTGATTATISVSPIATTGYTVTGTSVSGCNAVATVSLLVNPTPTLVVNPSSSTVCAGTPLTMTVSGVDALGSYLWNPGALTGTSNILTPSITTIYTITGTSAAGCFSSTTAIINVNSVPTITLSALPSSICNGGSSTLTANGSSTSYSWSPAGSTGTSSTTVVSPTITTVYSFTGSVAGCVGFNTLTLTVNVLPTVFIASTSNTICIGSSATLTASGTTSYTWNPGGATTTTLVVSPLATSIYTLNGSNGLNCSNSTTFTLTVVPIPTISSAASSPTICNGFTTALTGTCLPGLGVPSFSWLPINVTGSLTVQQPTSTTTYTLIGTENGCSSSSTLTVVVNPLPTLTLSASSPTICAGASTSMTALGGINYTWSPTPSTLTPISNSIVADNPSVTTTYTVNGNNINGCVGTNTILVNVVPTPTLVISPLNASVCAGSSLALTASGATSYTWLPSNTTGSLSVETPSATTIYTVIGDNGGGCPSTLTVSVYTYSLPIITASINIPIVCSGSSISLTGSGALNYSWSPISSTLNPAVDNPTISTTYTLYGTDNNGCVGQTTASISVNPLPTLTLSATSLTICAGASTSMTALGGINYTWSPIPSTLTPPSNSVVADNPSVTITYTVNGNDLNGCVGTNTILVNVVPTPTVIISPLNASVCVGSTVALTASGATSYTWLPSNTTGSLSVETPSATTTYTVIGDNGGGCPSTLTVSVYTYSLPIITASINIPIVCSGSSISLTGSGALNYSWSPISSTLNPAVDNPTISTTYTLYGTDNNGCVGQTTASISVNPLPTLTLSATSLTICAGASTSMTALGGINYTWSPIPSTLTPPSNSVVADNPSITTTYTVSGDDLNGCVGTETILVNVVPIPTVIISPLNASVCAGSTIGLTASGATSYTWLPSNTTGSLSVETPSATTTYTVIGDNGGGCPSTLTVSVYTYSLPIITASINIPIVCSGSSISLTGSGALNYSWSPISSTLNPAVDNPTISTTYTLYGTDNNGCVGQTTASISVNPLPTLTLSATSLTICAGASTSMTALGGINYTWSPIPSTLTPPSNSVVADNPSITTTYTVSGDDLNGCVGTETILITVVSLPTVVVSPFNASVCAGSSVALTANGATSYTWTEPGNAIPIGNTASVIVSPTITSTYTVIGDNGGGCPSTETVSIFVNPLPTFTAACSDTIKCGSAPATLTCTSTETNVIFSWNGPNTFTSSLQSPTVTVWGDYTLSVTNTITGCFATATINVATDGSIPSVTATSSGSITCAILSVTLTAVNTTTNPGFLWNGPGGFTNTTSSPTTSLSGIYTVTLSNLSNTCTATSSVVVGSHTNVTVTATIIPATCNGSVVTNNGSIVVSNFNFGDKFTFVQGASISPTVIITNPNVFLIPTNGTITSNLSGQTSTVSYILRVFDTFGCVKDFTLILLPTDCSVNSLGLAKAVSIPTLNIGSSYDVLYKVVVKNYASTILTNVVLTENLSATFPSPSSFSIVTSPSITSLGSSLTINPSFNGLITTNMTSATSKLAANKSDTITFMVKITPNGFFGPFNNTIKGTAINNVSIGVQDSSNTGLNPDPDGDLNPTKNNIPTTLTLTPNSLLGITKVGLLGARGTDKSFDVSYTVTAYNRGNDTLKQLVLKDNLSNTIKDPSKFTIKTPPIANGNVSANSLFDGKTDIDLLNNSSINSLPPGSNVSISFVINVNSDTAKTISNSAYGSAIGSNNVIISDTSNQGSDPDLDKNDICNEATDNIPTVLTSPEEGFFVPQAFTPNGDNIHDLFVINGLPELGTLSIKIYNRWGNKVYENSNYANNWDGTSNVSGALGSNKLPQGTYFYVIEITGIKTPFTKKGFIVLQY